MKDKESKKTARKLEAMRLIKLLRTQANESIEKFSVRLNADIVKIVMLLSKKDPGRGGADLNKKALNFLIRKAFSMKLKPGKGRVKDLVKVHKIIEKTIGKIKIEKLDKKKEKKSVSAGSHKPAPPAQPAAA